MRPYHFIIVLFLLVSAVLLIACDPTSTVVMPNNTSAETLRATVGITEDQNAIKGKSLLTFQFSTNLVQGDNTVQFIHGETVTCNGVTFKFDNPPYTFSVPQGTGYNCSYTGYKQGIGLLNPITMTTVMGRSILAPQTPSAGNTGYIINYTPDSSARACPITAEAKDSNANDLHGSASSSDQGVYHGPDITSLVGTGSILLQRTCTWMWHAPFDTVNLTYKSTASVAVTWSY